VSRRTLLVDLAIAAVLTILIVVLSPGLAVVGLVAALIVVICALSFALEARRRRRTVARNLRSARGNGKKVAAPGRQELPRDSLLGGQRRHRR
jgi:ABC-type bacteriocin/lantibiotic exporter with double-glycine peptidase domain